MASSSGANSTKGTSRSVNGNGTGSGSGSGPAPGLLDIVNPRDALLSLYTQSAIPTQVSSTVAATRTVRNQPLDLNIKVTARDFVVKDKDRTSDVVKSLFANDSHPLLKREEISYAVLTNHFDVSKHHSQYQQNEQAAQYETEYNNYNGNDANFEQQYGIENESNHSIDMRELHETRLNAHLNRHNYARPPILEVAGSPAQTHGPLNTDDPGIEQRQYYWNLPCRGTSFQWSNQYFEPSAPMILDRRSAQSKEKLPNAGSIAIQNRSKVVQKAKEEYVALKQSAELQMKEEDMIAENKRDLKKKLVAFRRAVYERLVERNDPSIGEIMRCVNEDLVFEFMQQFHGYSMPIDAIINLLGAQLGSDQIPPAEIRSNEVFDENDDGGIFLKAGIGASYHNPIVLRPLSPPRNAIPPKLEPINTTKQGLGGGFSMCPTPGNKQTNHNGDDGLVPLGKTGGGGGGGGGNKRRASKLGSNVIKDNLDDFATAVNVDNDNRNDDMDEENNDGDDEDDHMSEFYSIQTSSTRVKKAIEAMKEQLIREELLPSLHVIEKPLTTSMIHALGKRDVNFEEVFRELDRRKRLAKVGISVSNSPHKSTKEFNMKLFKSVLGSQHPSTASGTVGLGGDSSGKQVNHFSRSASKVEPSLMTDSLVSTQSKHASHHSSSGVSPVKAAHSPTKSAAATGSLTLGLDGHSVHSARGGHRASATATTPSTAASGSATATALVLNIEDINNNSSTTPQTHVAPRSTSKSVLSGAGSGAGDMFRSSSSFVSSVGGSPSRLHRDSATTVNNNIITSNNVTSGGGAADLAAFSPDASPLKGRQHSNSMFGRNNSNARLSGIVGAGLNSSNAGSSFERTNSISAAADNGNHTSKKPLIQLINPQLEELSRASSSRSLVHQRSVSSSQQSLTSHSNSHSQSMSSSNNVHALLEAYDADPAPPKARAPLGLKTKPFPSHNQTDKALFPYASLAEATLIRSGLGGASTCAAYSFVDRVRLIRGKSYKENEKRTMSMTSRPLKREYNTFR
jgi:hypothetical protein